VIKARVDSNMIMRVLKRSIPAVAALGVVMACSAVTFGGEIALTIRDARQRAVLANRRFLSAKEEISKAAAQISQARAGIFPDITATGTWDHNFKVPELLIQNDDSTMRLKMGFNNSFGASLMVQQALWEGGKVINAWAIAKLYREYSGDNVQRAEDEIVYTADVLFYSAILQRSNLEVLQKSLEAASENLAVVEKLYDKGMVSEFELLRAKVERANLQPALLQAESDLSQSHRSLKSFLGIGLRDTVQLVDENDDTSLAALPSAEQLTKTALEQRPDLQAAGHLRRMAGKAISIAKADYQPTLDGYARWAWSAQSDQFRLNQNKSSSATAGLSLNIPLFKGGRVGGQVAYRKAEYRQAAFAEEQLKDDVTLEVEEARDRLVQARKSLDVQKETIAQAEEGLRIANLRYTQSIGTQLEVLSAQAALSQARRAHAAALFFFRQAKAGLKKATTIDSDAK